MTFADDTSGSEENYDGGLLFSWAMHQITSHLKTLKIMLPKITEGGSLSNILDQSMVSLFFDGYYIKNSYLNLLFECYWIQILPATLMHVPRLQNR